MRGDPGTTDPQMISPTGIAFDPANNCANGNYMRIGIKNFGSNTSSQFFFQNASHGFSGSHTTTFTSPSDGQWHWVTVVLAYSDCPGNGGVGDFHSGGQVSRIRIDPVQTGSSSASDSFLVDFIALRQDTNQPNHPDVGIFPEEFVWTRGGFTITATGTDPPPLGFNGSANPDKFASGIGRFEWRIGTSGGFNIEPVLGENDQTGVATTSFNIPTSALTPGDNWLLVRCRDRCQAVGGPAGYFHLYYDPNPPGTPSVNVVSPGSWSGTNSFYFAWTNPGDDHAGVAYYQWLLDGTYSDYTGATSITLGMPWVGAHSFNVRAIDNAGNVGPWSPTTYAYFDDADPSPPPSVSVSPDGYAAQDQFAFAWPAAADGGGQSGIAGYWYSVDSGAWSFTSAQFIAGAFAGGVTGQHTFYVAAQDVAGNVSPAQGVYFYYYPQWRPAIVGLAPTSPQLALPQTFWWTPGAQNANYEVVLAADPGFEGPTSHFSTNVPWVTMPSNAAPILGQPYYWRVRDIASVPANWSATVSFQPYIAPPPPPGQVIGQEFPSGEAADGVNTSLGAVTRSFTIMTLRGPSGDIPLTAWYSSSVQTSGFLGPRWSWTLGQQLTPTTNPLAVTLEDNQQLPFTPSGPGFAPGSGIYDSLLSVSGGYQLVRPSRMRLTFDQNGVLQRLADRNGNAVTLGYQSGLITSFQDAAGRSFTVTTQNSRLTKMRDVLGREWNFEYNGSGYLSAFADANGNRTQFEYDGSGRLTRVVDPRGHDALRCTYGGTGRVSTQTDASGKVTTFTYDDANHRTVVTNPLGGTLVHVMDQDSRLLADVNERGDSTVYSYDANHNRIAVRDARGNTTRYEYDPRGNVTKVTDALGDVTQTVFDANNSPVSRAQPLGKHTAWTNDPVGNPTEVDEPHGKVTRHVYNGAGQLMSTTDANGHVTQHEYDGQGNRIRTTNGAGDVMTFGYDPVGRHTSTTDGLSHTMTLAYDAIDNLTSQTNGAGETTTYEYDANGNRTAEVDPRAFRTTHLFDDKDRLTQTTDALGNVSSVAYDDLDRRVSTTDPRGSVTTYTYDPVGNLLLERDQLGFQSSYTYDGNRNRLTTTDARGKMTAMAYDAMNRLLTTTDPLNHVTSSAYDSLGRVVSVTNPRQQTTRYVYDALDRLVSVQAPTGAALLYGYDLVGNRITTTNANGHTSTMAYDGADRLVTMADPLGHTQQFVYDAAGHRSRRTDARGRVTIYSFDAADRLVRTIYDDSTRIDRGYDPSGNLTSLVDQWGSDSYAYDGLNRITASTDHYGQPLAFAYDSTGNLTVLTYPGGQSCRYVYDPLNRLASVADWNNRAVAYSYDPTGNNTGQTFPNGVTTTQAFDDAGQLIAILTKTPAQDTLVSFAYTLDENGNRVRTARVDRREDPRRVGESDVYGTSAALSLEAYPTGADSVVIASGDTWVDAVNAPFVARRSNAPALMVPGDNLWASPAIQKELGRLKVARPTLGAVVLGDIGGVSAVVEAQLEQQGITSRRMRGADRFRTNALAAGSSSLAVLLGASDHIRAGAAALLAVRRGAVLLLTDRDSIPQPVRNIMTSVGVTRTILVGDESSIGGNVADWLNANGRPVLKRYDSADASALSVQALEHSVAAPDRFETLDLIDRDAYQDCFAVAAGHDAATDAALLSDPAGVLLSPDLVRWIGRHKGWLQHARVLGSTYGVGEQAEAELRGLLRTTITEYTYNPLDELASEIIPGVDSTHYTYDPMGNRSSVTHRNVQTSYTYDGADRLVAAAGVTYTYDANGNRLTRVGTESSTYAYDFENRLTQIAGPEGTSGYRYDGLGRRVRSQEPTATTRHLIDPTSKPYRMLREFDGAGQALLSYVFGAGLSSEVKPAGTTRYYHFDGLGSTAAVTDSVGSDLAHAGYAAFGDTALELGNLQSRFGFVGRYGVEATSQNLMFMRDRFYDPQTGMFISADPDDPSDRQYLDVIVYAYANNSPLNGIDPDGHAVLRNVKTSVKQAAKNMWSAISTLAPAAKNMWGAVKTLGPAAKQEARTIVRGVDAASQIGQEWLKAPYTMGVNPQVRKVSEWGKGLADAIDRNTSVTIKTPGRPPSQMPIPGEGKPTMVDIVPAAVSAGANAFYKWTHEMAPRAYRYGNVPPTVSLYRMIYGR